MPEPTATLDTPNDGRAELGTQRMIGDRLGKWVIFKELGRGGMGRVYLAQEELTGRQAAIKVLAAELAQEVGFLQRFQREIETLSKLKHPNIVAFYEAGLENGHYFFAMEYVEGQNLETILEAQGKLPWKEVLDIALKVVPAIRHFHDHGVIHRDLKPSNLIRTNDGDIKLTDFGIAKVFASTHLTATGGIVGTAEYLSPEQAAGKIVGRRSDLYCFGCVLYALLTGHPPFVGKSYVELLHKHRYGQFDRPELMAVMPREINDLVCKLLEKDPEKRPRDALVFLKQLDAIRAKLERKSSQTSADNRGRSTMAENRTDKISMADLPGPATLMSRFVRATLDEQNQGGVLNRFFNRPWVLVVILLLCIGVLGWKLWPSSQDELYAGGARLMESDSLYDMQRAWRDYLEPLESRYPGHPYKEKVEEFRQRLKAAESPPQPSEAQRFFQQGEHLKQQGDFASAYQVWHALIDVFDPVDAEKEWVERARRGLHELDKAGHDKDRRKHVLASLDRARQLHDLGKTAEAERILAGIEQLYRNDPLAVELLNEVKKARQR